MGRRPAALAIAVIATAALSVLSTLSGCAASHPRRAAAPAATATLAKDYTPYAATGAITVPVAANHASGTCWTGSITVPAPGVYRCLVGNAIADPCFARSASARQVVCASDPWSPATVVDLGAPLPAVRASHVAPRPWALELVNGTHCVAVTGTVAQVQTVSLLYACGSGTGAGDLDRTRSPMTVQYGPQSGPLTATVVTVVWN